MNYNPISQSEQNRRLLEISVNNQEIAEILFNSNAETIAHYLINEILEYQESLPDDEDVVMVLVQFGQNFILCVEKIGFDGCNLLVFHGTDSTGKPLKLIQHISQLDFLLQPEPKPVPEIPKRQIGFVYP